jgi:hypothetical protein
MIVVVAILAEVNDILAVHQLVGVIDILLNMTIRIVHSCRIPCDSRITAECDQLVFKGFVCKNDTREVTELDFLLVIVGDFVVDLIRHCFLLLCNRHGIVFGSA